MLRERRGIRDDPQVRRGRAHRDQNQVGKPKHRLALIRNRARRIDDTVRAAAVPLPFESLGEMDERDIGALAAVPPPRRSCQRLKVP